MFQLFDVVGIWLYVATKFYMNYFHSFKYDLNNIPNHLCIACNDIFFARPVDF